MHIEIHISKFGRAFLPHPPARRNPNQGKMGIVEVLRILSRKLVSQNRVRCLSLRINTLVERSR